jgi:hypothetical protein
MKLSAVIGVMIASLALTAATVTEYQVRSEAMDKDVKVNVKATAIACEVLACIKIGKRSISFPQSTLPRNIPSCIPKNIADIPFLSCFDISVSWLTFSG